MRRLAAVAALLLAVARCAGNPPQKEIDQAQAAVDVARIAGADRLAAEEYSAAATGLLKARDAVVERDYRQALSYAIDARQRAQNATRQAADARLAAQRATDALLADVNARLTRLRTRLTAAEAAHVPAKELRASQATLAEAQTALQEARTEIGAGKFEEGRERLDAVRKKLESAVQEMENIPLRPGRKTRVTATAPRRGLPPSR